MRSLLQEMELTLIIFPFLLSCQIRQNKQHSVQVQFGCFYLHFGITFFVCMAHASGKIFSGPNCLSSAVRNMLLRLQTETTICTVTLHLFFHSMKRQNQHQTIIREVKSTKSDFGLFRNRSLTHYHHQLQISFLLTQFRFVSFASALNSVCQNERSKYSVKRQMHICGDHFEVMMLCGIAFMGKLLPFIFGRNFD